ncbi:HAD family hydrolase [Occultella gossypii]|uniref:HAD family hydrolase n=1 Tax=Occultella gossypii TaxID=2800820 RepID=A0ABS7S805_9MICO|nr:HAD family hydrolase [Occultella gossypii]MBZ2196227.1 HAD family hydrolase [Occultella gossypii]
MPTPTLVLDFDGTVRLGDDPVRLYAQEVAWRVSAPWGEQIVAGAEDFLAGRSRPGDAQDGYQAVHALGFAAGLDRASMSAAYLASRKRLDAGEGEVAPPPGLGELLDGVRAAGVRTVLLTNAPGTGVFGWLDEVGLADRLGAVITDAGKPAAMPALLGRLLTEADLDGRPDRLLSIGDVWANDVGPALALGCAAFHIDRFDLHRGRSSRTTATFVELYRDVRDWAARD